MATIEETLRKLGLAAARGVPQLATGFVDLAALPFTMTGVMKPEQAVGSTAYLTSKGLLPPPQEGLLSETTELVSSAMNPATATKAALAKTGLLVAPMALTLGKGITPEVLASANPAEMKARKAIDNLVTQAKAYGIESPSNYSNVPVGVALSDLNQYLGQSTAVANLPDTAKETLRNLFGKAENAGIAYQRVHGEDKLMGKLPEAANKETLSSKAPWFSQELEDKFINKEITRKQYERQTMKNMDDYFGSGKSVKPKIDMQVDRANRFVFRENKNPDIILTTSPNEFDPKYMSAYLEVMDKPEKVGGKGTATRLYLEALDVAKKNKMGWKSDTITSDATKKMYERLTNMGIPFQQVDSQFILSPQQLSKINLQKLPKK